MGFTETWNVYPKISPKEDNSYLVHLTSVVALKLGLGSLSPIAIATYNLSDRKWTLNGGIVPYTFAENEIIEWHEIPQYFTQKS
jgi:hypothetical protein